MKIYNDVVSQLDSGGAHYSQELSEIDLSDPDDVKVMANNRAGEVLVHLGSSNYLERYKIYVTHVQEWQQQFDKLESVDLRYDRQIIVNPDLQGPAKQPPLSAAAAKKAMAAGVKPAALITRITSAPKPSPALTVKTVRAAAGETDSSASQAQAQEGRRRLRHHKAHVRQAKSTGQGQGKGKAGAAPRAKDAARRRRSPWPPSSRGETKPGNCQGRGTTIGMANQHEHLLTAIDVGSAKTCALVGGNHRQRFALSRSRRGGIARLAQRRHRGSGQSRRVRFRRRSSRRKTRPGRPSSMPCWAWPERTPAASTAMAG